MVLATASRTPQHVATLTLCHGAMAACFYAATAVVVLPIRGFHRLWCGSMGTNTCYWSVVASYVFSKMAGSIFGGLMWLYWNGGFTFAM